MPPMLRPHHVLVFGGFALGLLAGVFAFHTDPPFFGWLFGAGAGITGGAFFAAIASGQQLISGPRASRRDRDFDYDDEEDEDADAAIPRLLDGLPPRRDATER